MGEGSGGYVKRQFRVGSLTLAGGDEGGLCAEGEGWWELSGSERGMDLKWDRGSGGRVWNGLETWWQGAAGLLRSLWIAGAVSMADGRCAGCSALQVLMQCAAMALAPHCDISLGILSCEEHRPYPRSSLPLQSSMSMRAMEHSSGRMGRWSRVNQPPELSSSFCRCSSPLSYCAVKPTMRPFG